MGLSLADIEALFGRHGHHTYSGAPVSQLEHALQCAQLAEDEGAGEELVTAAFLHDIGHLLNYQGGVFDGEQSAAFLAKPYVREAVRLRRWDDRAKIAGAPTADFAHFLAIAARCALT